MASADGSRCESTARVWFPMSGGRVSYQVTKFAATASSIPASALPVSASATHSASASATHNAIDVSSVHSPGAQSNGPPPTIAIS